MSSGLNKVFLFGNLGADPELRHTQSGTAVLNLRLATNEWAKDGERVEWHDVVVWDKMAEGLAKILRKGSTILVEGRNQTRSYEGKDGSKRYKTEVVARNVCLPGRSSDDQRGAGQHYESRAADFSAPPAGDAIGGDYDDAGF